MFKYLADLLYDNWGKLLGMVTFLMFIPAYLQARYLWRRRRFLTRINFSLNFLENETLRFRTLAETDLARAMLNNVHAIRLIYTTPRSAKPGAFLLFADRAEAWTILSTLLNEISAEFAEGFVARSMGLPCRSEWYDIGITCEEHTDLKTTKFRVMIAARKMLEELARLDSVQFEQPHHHIRAETLRQMWQILQDDRLKHNIMQMELSVRLGS